MLKKLFFIVILLKATLIFSQDISRKKWVLGDEPNYSTNVDLEYPYSEQEYSSGNVNPIPALGSFIDLIDFYGEGRINDVDGTTGFKNAYNIAHQYQLVSNGPDLNRKIPNRIPVTSFYGPLNLSKYVRSNSVSNITLMGAPLQQNTIEEMVRMIRKDGNGKIIIYGFDASDSAITVLEKELNKIGFLHAPSYILEPPFHEIKGFQSPPRVYKNNKITVVGEKTFWSPNPKTNFNVSQNDMATIDYSSLLKLNADLSGGIKGKINKPGGRIRITVYAYNEAYPNGIQKFIEGDTSRDKVVYKIYSNVTDTVNYVAKTSSIIYGFARNMDNSYRALGKTDSDNIKLLGSESSNGWTDSGCNLNIVRAVRWLTWQIKSLYRDNVAYECQDVITKIISGTQPVIVEVSIKDATLYNFKIPGLNDNTINFIDATESTKEYKVSKKLRITVLESPNEFKSSKYYKDQINTQISKVNAYYTGKTGNIKSTDIAAKVGNPRILFQNIELVLKKGSRESYDIASETVLDIIAKEVSLNDNDNETIPIIYAHSLILEGISRSVIHGFTYAMDDIINDYDFCIFSYNAFLNTMSNQGDPASTIAHEIGHYFGLSHPFQGGCAQTDGGDQVDDTPPAEGSNWFVAQIGTPQEHLLENPCQNAPRTCNGKRRQIENIMDYGPCRWLFTQGQTNRMMARIRTKPSLFNTFNLYDSSVDPSKLNITVRDLRTNNPRRKRAITNSVSS